jgi:cell division inhibitor SulA
MPTSNSIEFHAQLKRAASRLAALRLALRPAHAQRRAKHNVDTLRIEALNLILPLAAVYVGVEFD